MLLVSMIKILFYMLCYLTFNFMLTYCFVADPYGLFYHFLLHVYNLYCLCCLVWGLLADGCHCFGVRSYFFEFFILSYIIIRTWEILDVQFAISQQLTQIISTEISSTHLLNLALSNNKQFSQQCVKIAAWWPF